MNRRRASAPMLRSTLALSFALLLAACAGHPQKKPAPAPATTHAPARPPARKPWKPQGPYTPGGLYAPDVADGAPEIPPDIANLPEPVPHAEPLSRYGNRSPYVVLGKTYTVLPSAAGYVERGMASWYGTKFDGRVTSSLESYDLTQFSAAHRTLPLPSYARVTNLENGRSVVVRINDRGPFHEGRLIDLSYAAAIKLGVNVHGTAQVEVRGIDPGQPLPPAPRAASATTDATRTSRAVAMPKPAAPAPKPTSSPNPTQASSLAASQSAAMAPNTTAPAASGTTTGGIEASPAAASTTSAPDIVLPAPERPPIDASTLGFLQVASYSDRGNAERMLQRLQQAGVDKAELVSVQIDAQVLWRVHVGPLRADEAERVAE
ncbi:MAG: septal ring lytic transglycosylase RlpA family protein, partial [Bacillota bacterium]|nr:septal ring lytic transglycosylase RlpA family protein [Bacillota bacterium]